LPAVEETPENALKFLVITLSISQLMTFRSTLFSLLQTRNFLKLTAASSRKEMDKGEFTATVIHSVVSEYPNDANIYPAEFLHTQTPSGVPPHVLLLNPGTVVMLIRNVLGRLLVCEDHAL
jgi:hypothetical protein